MAKALPVVIPSSFSAGAAWFVESLEHNTSGLPRSAQLIAESTEWKNALLLPVSVRQQMPRIAASWLRNLVAGTLLYYLVGLGWCAVVYGLCRRRFFPKGGIPSLEAQLAQIWVSQKALVLYSLMPTLGEWLGENGFTRAVMTSQDVGGVLPMLAWTALYLFVIEFLIYWIHRALHHPLLKWLHADHHKYNTGDALSPWAGLAFHPLDGMLQASPYVLLILFMPIHFWTFEILLFTTAIWTTNIHDTVVGKTEPIMGSAYHTLHHTEWVVNYGQFFIFFDWLFGTLHVPDYGELKGSHQGSWAAEDAKEKSD